jgi:iron complex transport system permease protein
VLFSIRLPRVVAAAVVGAALAAAGSAYQSLFRNPLVSPDILGVSTGAGLGAVTGILLGMPVAMIQLLGFGGGLAVVMTVIMLSRVLRGSGDILVMVLAGIVVGALAGAAISLVKVLADPYDQLPAITFWLLGSLAGVKAGDVAATVPVVLVGVVPLVLLRWQVGILSLGDDEARALGVEVATIRAVVIAGATLATASVVAISGVIGWVGLMVPHMARLLIGPRFDRQLPASILIGAAFMVAVDTLARSAATIEIPLGVLTAVIGGPVFVWLLARSRRSFAS